MFISSKSISILELFLKDHVTLKTGEMMLKIQRHHRNNYILKYKTVRAGGYIEHDYHAHLVSEAGSVISGKSPSPVFRWSSIYSTEP